MTNLDKVLEICEVIFRLQGAIGQIDNTCYLNDPVSEAERASDRIHRERLIGDMNACKSDLAVLVYDADGECDS